MPACHAADALTLVWTRSSRPDFARSDFPYRPLGLVVVHDDVGALGRAGRGEVELLGGAVAVVEASLDLGDGAPRRQVSRPGASECLLARDGHEDVEVPP